MGRSRRDKYPDLGEHAIFGNEEAAAMRSELADVVARVDDLTERINAQFTSISAHAEISRVQMSEVREEARADMERSRDMLVDLIDRLRDELGAGATQPTAAAPADADGGSLPPPPAVPGRDEQIERRIDTVERTIDDVISSLERCERRQRQMAETMTSFIDTMLGLQMGTDIDGAGGDTDEQPPVPLVLA